MYCMLSNRENGSRGGMAWLEDMDAGICRPGRFQNYQGYGERPFVVHHYIAHH